MNEYLKKLVEARARVWEQTKEILERSGTGPLDADDETAYQAANAELDSLDVRIAEVEDLIDRDDAAQASLENSQRLAERGAGTPAPQADDNSELAQLRSLMAGERRAVEFSAPNPAEQRVLNTSDDSNAVPTSFYNQLVEHMIDVSSILQTNVTVITTASGEALQVPTTATYAASVQQTEGNTITASEPTFGQVTLNAYKYGHLTQVTPELIADSGFDVLGFLARQGGRALGERTNTEYMVGDGTGDPAGVVPNSTLGKTAAGAAAITADELIDLFYSVIAPYRNVGSWMLADATMAAVRKLTDDNNQYLWAPGLAGGEPSTILDRPYYTDPNMPAMTTGLKSVIFGDMSAYAIRRVGSVRIERSDDFAFNDDLVTFRYIVRTDGHLLDTTGAVKHLIQA